MSPDSAAELAVAAMIAAAIRRARLLASGEALGWGIAAAAITPAAGGLIAAAVAVARWRGTSRASIVRVLERAHPGSRNLLVTADELARETLLAKPLVRARVFAAAAVSATAIDVRTAVRNAPLVRAVLFAALAWTTAGAVRLWRNDIARERAGIVSRATPPVTPPAPPRLQVTVAIEPPPYTNLKGTRVTDPEQIQAVEGSAVVLSIDAAAATVTIEHDGRTRTLARGADNRFTERLTVTKTGYVLIVASEASPKPAAKVGAEAGRRMMPVVVSLDALPAVRLTAPARDLVYAGGNPRIAFDVRATDDFGLRSLALRYTRVSGSGENFEFKEGEIPLVLEPASARDWSGRVSRSLTELDLKDGDMLVYRAVAADARPGDGSASSDAFFIEVSRLGAAAGDAFTLPEEESKYALSQQMLIVKTERLHRRRASLPPAELAEQSRNLAVEQRMIRAEFVFMLGGEVDDEEVEAEQSVELQAGRLQNRGQRDLRAATMAMSQAEKLLTGTDTAAALIAERTAVTALQRVFSRDRYILRALATRGQLDPSRRLTGVLAGAADWRRVAAAAPVNRRAALLQDLLRGIASVGSDPGLLAEEAIRIDPTSASLRTAAAELQRAAAATDPGLRAQARAAAAAAATAEARRAHAEAPLAAPVVAPALSGAFADALRRRR